MTLTRLPLAYRWFLIRGLANWQPWYFLHAPETDSVDLALSRDDVFERQFKTETEPDFDVFLFARRQDMDDFAFFVVRDGAIEDRVVSIHLSFAKRFELKQPLRHSEIGQTFTQWIREVALSDVEHWISEEDLLWE
jgi:hypothetical protein